jgi:hypothetical protein
MVSGIKTKAGETVKARCIQDVGMSAFYGGKRYSFNHKEWTECPMIIYTRNIRTLELFKKEELKKEPKSNKRGK